MYYDNLLSSSSSSSFLLSSCILSFSMSHLVSTYVLYREAFSHFAREGSNSKRCFIVGFGFSKVFVLLEKSDYIKGIGLYGFGGRGVGKERKA